MVKVFFDLYGHDFSTLINHDILSKHVTKVGLLYAFYVAKVGNPKCNHDLHSSTRRVIYCESCDWEICFACTSGGRTNGGKKRDPSMFGPWRLKFLPKLHVHCEIFLKYRSIILRRCLVLDKTQPRQATGGGYYAK